MMLIFFFITISLSATADELRECVMSCARKQVGKPYVWGATGPDSFDCSGLVCYCYDQCGIGFGYRASTRELINEGIEVSQSNIIKADLVFPSSDHVTLYCGTGDDIIHANGLQGIVQEYYIYSFWRARRIIQGGNENPDNGGNTAGDSGYTTVTAGSLDVKSSASLSSSTVATYSSGDSIYYDSVVRNGEGSWISYVGGSGIRRYCLARTSSGSCNVSPCPK